MLPATKAQVFRAGAGWKTEDVYSMAMDERMPISWPWTAMEGVLLRVSVDQTGSTYPEVSVNRAVEERSGAIPDTTGTSIIKCL